MPRLRAIRPVRIDSGVHFDTGAGVSDLAVSVVVEEVAEAAAATVE